MNGITVPPEHKHLLRKRGEHDPEGKLAMVKNYILNHPGEVIKLEDINKAGNMTTARTYLNKLISQGKVTRHRKPGKGHQFSYRWHDEPLLSNQHRSPDGVITTSLGLPTFPLDEADLAALKELFATWCDEELPLGDQMGGVVLFRRWLAKRWAEVNKERKQKLQEHSNASS